jgi:hypothetical protein
MTDPTPKQPTEPPDSTRLREVVRKKVDAWIASQPEPRPTRSEAIERLLAEALAREAAARAARPAITDEAALPEIPKSDAEPYDGSPI